MNYPDARNRAEFCAYFGEHCRRLSSAPPYLRKASIPAALAAAVGIALSACSLVPVAVPAARGPSIEQVVARVKCDLKDAVKDYLLRQDYPWFQTWTAQVNLNFIVNDQSSLTPGVSFIQPLTTDSIPFRVTNGSRSATLGLGAGFNNTATRNETLTFSMSLQDIVDDYTIYKDSPHRLLDCSRSDIMDINSELGLRQWMADAFSPINDTFLVSGHHKSSRGGGRGAGAFLIAQSSVNLMVQKSSPTTGLLDNCPSSANSNLPTWCQNIKKDLCVLANFEIDDPTDTTPPSR